MGMKMGRGIGNKGPSQFFMMAKAVAGKVARKPHLPPCVEHVGHYFHFKGAAVSLLVVKCGAWTADPRP